MKQEHSFSSHLIIELKKVDLLQVVFEKIVLSQVMTTTRINQPGMLVQWT